MSFYTQFYICSCDRVAYRADSQPGRQIISLHVCAAMHNGAREHSMWWMFFLTVHLYTEVFWSTWSDTVHLWQKGDFAFYWRHKYVPDSSNINWYMNVLITLTPMQSHVGDLVHQSTENAMKFNVRITKEMLIGSILKDRPTKLSPTGITIDRVSSFRLLCVYISNDLKWTQHVNAISSKVASRMHFLKLLKRSGATLEDLLHLYTSVLQPFLEYACPVWHSSLTTAQTEALES